MIHGQTVIANTEREPDGKQVVQFHPDHIFTPNRTQHMLQSKPHKPTSSHAYGSIGHIQGSYLTSGDKYLHEGQSRILTTKARDRHDTIIVQEKYDGTCVAVVKLDGKLIPIQRRGYHCDDSPHEQHRLFARWVESKHDQFAAALREGERMVGEWLIMAHGTRYTFNWNQEPFVVFDIFTAGDRMLCSAVRDRCWKHGFSPARLLHYAGPVAPETIMPRMVEQEIHPHIYTDEPEGLVYRCERHGKVDFLGKYVRQGFTPGMYFQPDGMEPVWNMDPSLLFNTQQDTVWTRFYKSFTDVIYATGGFCSHSVYRG